MSQKCSPGIFISTPALKIQDQYSVLFHSDLLCYNELYFFVCVCVIFISTFQVSFFISFCMPDNVASWLWTVVQILFQVIFFQSKVEEVVSCISTLLPPGSSVSSHLNLSASKHSRYSC